LEFVPCSGDSGAAARIAAIGGISMGEEHAPSVFYVSELASLYTARGSRWVD
jgi:hypothetical protein